MVGICLPDETNTLLELTQRTPRRLTPRDSAARPLYVTEQGAHAGVRGGRVQVTRKTEMLGEARLLDVSQINLYGNAQAGVVGHGWIRQGGYSAAEGAAPGGGF